MSKEELKCPLCRVGFGALFVTKGVANHIDLFWSREAGLMLECSDQEYALAHCVETEKGLRPSEEFNKLLIANNDEFIDHPELFSKENISPEHVTLLVQLLIKETDLEEGEEFNVTIPTVEARKAYEEGKNFKEIFGLFIIKNSDV